MAIAGGVEPLKCSDAEVEDSPASLLIYVGFEIAGQAGCDLDTMTYEKVESSEREGSKAFGMIQRMMSRFPNK